MDALKSGQSLETTQKALRQFLAWRLVVDLGSLAKLLQKAIKGKSSKKVIHNLRVLSRKLRVTLRNFRSLFSDTQFQSLNELFRNFADQLSMVRELDVLHQQFKKFRKQTYTEKIEQGLSILETTCAQISLEKRSQIPAASRNFSESPEFTELAVFITENHISQSLGSVGHNRDVLNKAQIILQRQLKKVKECAHALDSDVPEEAFHQLRIALKNLRYTLDDFTCLRGDGFAKQLSRMELLQDLMGAIHDRQVWKAQSQEILAVIGETVAETTDEWESAAGAVRLLVRDWEIQIESDYSDVKKIWFMLDRDGFWSTFQIIEQDSEQRGNPFSSERENEHLEDLSEGTPE